MKRFPNTPAAKRPWSPRAFPTCLALLGALALFSPSLHAQALSEDFDDGVANDWAVVSGSDPWDIPAGTDRVYTNANTAGATLQISTYTGATWETNFVLRARVKLWGTGPGNRVGLVYNYQPGSPAKYYAIMLHKESTDPNDPTKGPKLMFYENTTGAADPTPVQTHSYAAPSSSPDNFWVDLTISRIGTTTTVRVTNSNGTSTFTRNQTAISGAGRIGVIDRSANSAFNNIIVDDITPGITEPFGSGPTYTPTYYVDSNAPDDSGNGTISDPWKYAPGMPGSSRSASPGDVIALKCGSVWRLGGTWNIPSSGTSGSPIVYTAYGSGDLPKITVLEDLSTGWSAAGGSYNTDVYQKTLPSGMVIERLYINDEGMGEAFSQTPAAENWVGQNRKVKTKLLPFPNPNGVVLDTMHDTGILKYWRQDGDTLYLYSPAGNPNTLGQRIEGLKAGISYAVRVSNKSYVTLDQLEVHGGTVAVVRLDSSGSTLRTDVRVTNSIVRSAMAKGIYVAGENTALGGFSNGVIKWNRVDAGDGPTTRTSPNGADYAGHPTFVTVGPNDPNYDPLNRALLSYSDEGQLGSCDGISLFNNVQGWIVAQNEVSNFWHAQLKICVNSTTYVHPDATESAVANIIEHNEVHAENINYAHGLEINAGSTSATVADDQVKLMLGNVARYNHIYNTWVNNKHEGRETLFYGNLIVGVFGSPRDPTGNNGWSGDGVAVAGHGTSTGGVFAYNTIVDAAGAALALTSRTPPENMLIINNIFSHSGNRRANSSGVKYSALRDQNYPTADVEVDNNLLFSPHTDYVVEHRQASTGSTMIWDLVADMSTINPDWNDNIGDDPLFTNYGTADLTLGGSSPARGAAEDITALLPETLGWNNLGCWQTP